MIYNIKKSSNEEILYLYFDYNYEFANLNILNNKISFLEQIKNYIKNMKIDFKGKYIIAVIAGVAVTLTCSFYIYDQNNNCFKPDYNTLEIVKYETHPTPIPNKYYILNNEENYIKNENFEEKVNNSINEQIKKDESSQDKIDNQTGEQNQVNKIEQNQETNIKNETQEIEKEININKTFVVVYRNNGTVETIELEEYLIGVVGAEMPASFNIEALKAQAIVARTYALKRINENKVLTDTTSTQVYKDNNQLETMWGKDYYKYYNKIKNAVDSTKDLVITYNNELIDAVFHSTSNGYTVDAKDVWKNDIPYLKSVESHWDLTATSYLRNTTKEISDIAKNLGITINDNSNINIICKDENGRVLEVNIDGNLYSGIELRNKLGLRSTDFDIEINGNTINFITKGYGHGVGMSQYGAQGMALEGYNYKQIINHYYKNIQIIKK